MTLLALHAQRLRRRQAHHSRLPSQARTTKLYWCRRCDAIFSTPPFISCKDGHTKICSDCSLIEDLEATGIKARYDGPQYWTIEQHLQELRRSSAPAPPSPARSLPVATASGPDESTPVFDLAAA
jgi:hypothetical protein